MSKRARNQTRRNAFVSSHRDSQKLTWDFNFQVSENDETTPMHIEKTISEFNKTKFVSLFFSEIRIGSKITEIPLDVKL